MNDTKPTYKNLVLEGGGILGIAYCGALEELHKRGILAGLRNYAASSAGSIAAGALACGASFSFISSEFAKVDFGSFMDYDNGIKAAYNLFYYNGVCPGTVFEDWYGSILEKLTGNANITLKQVHERFGGRLVITATSINTRRAVYFDYRSHPNIPLKKLVRMSSSLPFMFIPVEYDNDLWVDGGVLDNFPIRAFHKETDTSDRINPRTLGLMLTTALDDSVNYPKVTGLVTFIEALVGCYLTQTQKLYMEPQDWSRTIKIPCGKISSFNFYIDAETKKELVEIGRKAVHDHLQAQFGMTQKMFYIRTEPIFTGYRAEDELSPQNSPDTHHSILLSKPIQIMHKHSNKHSKHSEHSGHTGHTPSSNECRNPLHCTNQDSTAVSPMSSDLPVVISKNTSNKPYRSSPPINIPLISYTDKKQSL